ncbi:MAG TPA: aldo/keto reductase [Vicinamibacteria bacterium]|nr:aldo/keto reductase [Vicinamibacteria bacterium]
MSEGATRREFLKQAAAGATVAALAEQVLAQTSPAGATGLPTRVLGRTGERVSILCLGGWHLGTIADEAEAVRFVHAALDEGVTFLDNAWDYHDGRSEELMGRALAQDGRRDKAFVMTKNCERDHAGSMRCLEDSLRRLRTDHVDLWQFHEMVYDNDPDWVFEKGGMRAALEARQAGKVRFIGFTGHKHPAIHLRMLSKPHDWDTAQMPINVMDAHYRSFQVQVVPECLRRNVGVIGMKGYGGSHPKGVMEGSGLTALECYRYALSQPVATQVVGLTTPEHLRQAVDLARSFRPLTEDEKSALLTRVKDVAGDGRYELFKSSQAFDGPHHRRQHGFQA